MSTFPKLKSLSIFFPFYNDAGTVEKQITLAYEIGAQVTDDLEVIAIHGGNSKDNTLEEITKMQTKFPALKIVDKKDNKEGYAVIKHGFLNATKEWVFYTDGDAQYDLKDIFKLVELQTKTGADVANGYKIGRQDNFLRVLFGEIYRRLARLLFNLPIKDVDCNFRLIRKSFLDKFKLESTDASILPEMIVKLRFSGAKFAEVGVGHYDRVYGKSNYTAFSLAKEKILGDLKLYGKIKKISKEFKHPR